MENTQKNNLGKFLIEAQPYQKLLSAEENFTKTMSVLKQNIPNWLQTLKEYKNSTKNSSKELQDLEIIFKFMVAVFSSHQNTLRAIKTSVNSSLGAELGDEEGL